MGYRNFCDECGATISEGPQRKPHIALTRYSGEGDDYASDYAGGRDFCDRACLLAFLNSGKDL